MGDGHNIARLQIWIDVGFEPTPGNPLEVCPGHMLPFVTIDRLSE